MPGRRGRRRILSGLCSRGTGFRKITFARPDLITIVIGNFNFDFVVLAVGNEIGWTVGEGVLIAKFVADVLK